MYNASKLTSPKVLHLCSCSELCKAGKANILLKSSSSLVLDFSWCIISLHHTLKELESNMYFAFAASLIWETLVEENREQIVSSIPLVECSRGSSDFLLSVSSWNDFSKDTGLSSLVSIEPNTDCSQWLSSVSDMKERAQAHLTAPKQRFQSKKDVQEGKRQPTCTVKQRRML